MKLNGKLTIWRSTRDEDNKVEITVRDDAGRSNFTTIEISKLDLMNALFGRGDVPCQFTYEKETPLGKKLEVKHENVLIKANWYDKDKFTEAAQQAIAAYEIDGWKGRFEDAMNRHNAFEYHGNGHATYRISFSRHVDQ